MKLALLTLATTAAYASKRYEEPTRHVEGRFLEQQYNITLGSAWADKGRDCDVGFDDFYGEYSLQCKSCTDQACIVQNCTVSLNSEVMDCSLCMFPITDSDYDEFCIDMDCNSTQYLEDGAAGDACVCEKVSIDDTVCDACSLCSSKTDIYDHLGTGKVDYALQAVNLECSGANNSASCPSDAYTSRNFSELQPYVVAGAVGVFVSVLAICYYCSKREKKVESKKIRLVYAHTDDFA